MMAAGKSCVRRLGRIAARGRLVSRNPRRTSIHVICVTSISVRPLQLVTLPHLGRDTRLLFATRFIRLFAYGSLSVVLMFYLVGLGLNEQQVGVQLTLNEPPEKIVRFFTLPAAANLLECPL